MWTLCAVRSLNESLVDISSHWSNRCSVLQDEQASNMAAAAALPCDFRVLHMVVLTGPAEDCLFRACVSDRACTCTT